MVSLTRKSCTILPARVVIRGGSTALRQNRLGLMHCLEMGRKLQAFPDPMDHLECSSF